MKNLLFIFFIYTLIVPSGLSQSLTLSDTNGIIPDDGTIQISGYPTTTLVAHVFVTNNTSSTINVKVKKEYISIVPGTNNTFCWGNCYLDTTFYSIAVPVAAGYTDSSNFIADYYPNGLLGHSIIKYIFFDENDTTDATSVNIEFIAYINSLETRHNSSVFAEPFPNPATNQVTFDYSFPKGINEADVIIRDILGNSVKQVRITDQEGKIRINTEDLTSGLFFYSVIVNDNIALSKKLIINR